MARRLSFALVVGLPLVACGGAPPPAAAPERLASTEPAVASATPVADVAEAPVAPTETTLPTKCAVERDGYCLPESQWVDRLCNEQRRTVALSLFAKGTPWTRGYLTRKTKAWNASGGVSSEGDLEWDEEVIVLRRRDDGNTKDGMQVSGMGGYDALRWDGGCVSLASEELTLTAPPAAKTPHLVYRLLDEPLREALREDKAIDEAVKKQRQECKGATMGSVSDKCEKADKALGRAIVAYVRGGGALPQPSKLP
jgi:hypothetical protein